MLTGGGQNSAKEQLTSVRKQLSCLQSVINCLLELSIHYQLHSMSGCYSLHTMKCIILH